jgi:hypothetical protein
MIESRSDSEAASAALSAIVPQARTFFLLDKVLRPAHDKIIKQTRPHYAL